MNIRARVHQLLPETGLIAIMILVTSCGGNPTAPSPRSPSPSTPTPPSPTPDPSTVLGTYTFSWDASPACGGLPDVAKHRTYTAVISQVSGNKLNVAPDKGPSFDLWLEGNGVVLVFESSYGNPFGYEFVEPLNDGTLFVVVGDGSGHMSDSEISGSFSGEFGIYSGPCPWCGQVAACQASDHRFTFVRQ